MANFLPNTKEWEKMRQEMVGASDAPIIMGVSPYETAYQLWQRKLDLVPPKQSTYAMNRGHELEPVARDQAQQRLGCELSAQVKFHPSIPWMMATVDGISPDSQTLVEIKCPGAIDQRTALEGHIPEKYIPQLQHQLEVCELEKGFYFSFDGQEGVMLEFYRDDKYIKKLVSIEKEFYSCMQDLTPPALTNRDFYQIDCPEWDQVALRWKQINSQLTALEQEEKKLREWFIQRCCNQSSSGGGVNVTRFVRKGSIDYAKIPQLKGVEVEKYRKKSVEVWKIIEAK